MPSQKPINTLAEQLGAIIGISLIADKWTLMLIYVLNKNKVMRYREIQHVIDKISSKMLTQTLRKLERDGLVTRNIYPVIPPKVEYALTDLGYSLVPLIESFCTWTSIHQTDVEAAQQRYDEQLETLTT